MWPSILERTRSSSVLFLVTVLQLLFSAFLGGPANTTYGENTGVIGMTRIASVSVIRNAAFIAIALSFLGKFTALICYNP